MKSLFQFLVQREQEAQEKQRRAETATGYNYQKMGDEPRGGNPVLNRYRDLYRIARVLVGIGDTVKVIGIVVGSLILFGGLVIAGSAGVTGLFLGGVVGAVYGGIIYLLGLLISAQGQMLLVQADSAVHSSPFMTDEEKAKVMSLSFPPAVEQIHG